VYFPDLTPYQFVEAYQDSEPDWTRAHVGWLDTEHPFPTAKPSLELVNALHQLVQHPVRIRRGFHECAFCHNAQGCAEIDVVGRSIIYAAPILIAHYVQTHHYRPPEAFVDAVIQQAKKVGSET
jgi:hypothetical protein